MQEGGVEVIIDDYDLKEGQDIVAYMERSKTDESLFAKAKASTSPDRLALVTGRQSWSVVRDEFIPKFQDLLKGSGWSVFRWGTDEYLSAMGFQE